MLLPTRLVGLVIAAVVAISLAATLVSLPPTRTLDAADPARLDPARLDPTVDPAHPLYETWTERLLGPLGPEDGPAADAIAMMPGLHDARLPGKRHGAPDPGQRHGVSGVLRGVFLFIFCCCCCSIFEIGVVARFVLTFLILWWFAKRCSNHDCEKTQKKKI
jgi:hypothetical protein